MPPSRAASVGVWMPWTRCVSGIIRNTEGAFLACCVAEIGGAWDVTQNRPPRWLGAAGVVVGKRRFHFAEEHASLLVLSFLSPTGF